ncbi:tetratricopeptide repeat protein [Streptomyces sp. NBC_00356]|uniref:tetratricopeptide repeat protein n=1 Tax=Streptomyces sp. NBC_00356 TaxID=2975724 RepID=UPI002E2702A5
MSSQSGDPTTGSADFFESSGQEQEEGAEQAATEPTMTSGAEELPTSAQHETSETQEGAAAAVARYRPASGRYRSSGGSFQLELRVDVDSTRSGSKVLRRVSGDFFTTTGGTTAYFGSFTVHGPTVTWSATQVVIKGLGSYTWQAGAPVVRVTIPRRLVGQPPAAATVQFLTVAGQAGASYLCPYISPYFRALTWEQDSVTGKIPFLAYNTGSLPRPPGSPARSLSVPGAYAEAGIQLLVSGAANVVADSPSGWSDSELHGAMQTNFSQWRNVPQWKAWLFVAGAYEGLAGVRGIMFDAADSFQRQGCAVFYDLIKGADPETQRAQLRTYVHELGHSFNLLHSWQKNLARPPAPLGPKGGFGDLSWMNYPQNYQSSSGPTGTAAYWSDFPFQFTDNELIHLRHGHYRNVIMGANAFATGAADIEPELFDEPLADESGLRLGLRGAKSGFAFGEPVVVELKLETTDLRGRSTHGHLHPDDELVNIAIRQPSGRTVLYRPLRLRCVDQDETVRLDTNRPAIYSSAYIGYGGDGHYFQQPGTYQLRASYQASDGSRIVSPVLRIVVRHPVTAADSELAELMMGEEQGKLLVLRGSDSPSLRAGNEALQEVIERHANPPFAVYARLAKGLNAEHEFKSLKPDKTGLTVRAPDTKSAIEQLTPVVKASQQGKGVDNLTLNLATRRLARAYARQGDVEEAGTILDRLVRHFDTSAFNPHVVEAVRAQAESTKAKLMSDFGPS